jgi:hypothetical protein
VNAARKHFSSHNENCFSPSDNPRYSVANSHLPLFLNPIIFVKEWQATDGPNDCSSKFHRKKKDSFRWMKGTYEEITEKWLEERQKMNKV